MKIKVCGMRNTENVKALLELPIDYVGLIFYEKSKRNITQDFTSKIDFENKEKVGVFVNASAEFIQGKSAAFNFVTIQLHGKESPEFCKKMQGQGFKVIKAFSVDEKFNFSETEKYSNSCDFFLFDTKGKLPGGNGYTFDWKLLENYKGETPFLLSGGINISHAKIIKGLKINALHAIDLNSGFELEPAVKDISLLKKFIEDVRN